ncbi:hypothetical protein AURDEDRAFT_160772 [Auricularia subglabra TFB-10046 SS5]|nr:hypothetical protein AURDEDRAFT_160772 [Auricularia subglabra TFB-10046 SS5]
MPGSGRSCFLVFRGDTRNFLCIAPRHSVIYTPRKKLIGRASSCMVDPNLILGLQSSQVYKIVVTCNAALFVYEYLITIGDEVELLWATAWGPAPVLYFATRYSALPEICLDITFSIVVGMLLGQSIIVLRTWALWDGSRAVIRTFIVAGVLSVGIYSYLNVNWGIRTKFAASNTITPLMHGCIVTSPYHFIYIGRILFCCNDLALIMLTLIKYLQDCRCRSQTPQAHQDSVQKRVGKLSNSLYMNAFTSFGLMLVIAIANLVVTLLVPTNYRFLLSG